MTEVPEGPYAPISKHEDPYYLYQRSFSRAPELPESDYSGGVDAAFDHNGRVYTKRRRLNGAACEAVGLEGAFKATDPFSTAAQHTTVSYTAIASNISFSRARNTDQGLVWEEDGSSGFEGPAYTSESHVSPASTTCIRPPTPSLLPNRKVPLDWQYPTFQNYAQSNPSQIDTETDSICGPVSIAYRDSSDSAHNTWCPESRASPPIDLTSEALSGKSVVADQVCFGMLAGIPTQVATSPSPCSPRVSLQLIGEGKFYLTENTALGGTLDRRFARILQTLLDDERLLLEPYLLDTTSPNSNRKGLVSMNVILYGSMDSFEDVGDFCEDCGLFLQDPVGCERNAVYRNPHRLSALDEAAPMTFDLATSLEDNIEVDQDYPTNILEELNTITELGEIDSPAALSTNLLRHQKQALYFMACRECGWALSELGKDLWSESVTSNGRVFINNVNGARQTTRPNAFRGGILADPMGLGKSLSVISLVGYDICGDVASMPPFLDDGSSVTATLLVVPLPLISTWEDEFRKHVRPGQLVLRRHHGTSRITNVSQLSHCHVVMTTYHTLESEWRGSRRGSSPVFSVRWRRIVLDEAHYIKQKNSNTTKALCSLHAASRWAVTGTPLQNRLTDLSTLLTFLRVYPYDDPRTFDQDITRLWKSNQGPVAVERLKRLLRSILLRRPQNIVVLPTRTNRIQRLTFSGEESTFYGQAKARAVRILDSMLTESVAKSSAPSYLNALQRINELRLICDLGVHRSSNLSASPEAATEDVWTPSTAQRMFESMTTSEEPLCSQCFVGFGSSRTSTNALSHIIYMSRCLKIFCRGCVYSAHAATSNLCEHGPTCPVASVSNHETLLPQSLPSFSTPQKEMPTKIRALITDLCSLPRDVKSIVFSYWRCTLNLMEEGFKGTGISYVRFDGSLSAEKRTQILNQFRSDLSTSVILMTISCSAVGLDITAASRAYLMEPHWNPTVEEQALARVHRMGQTKEVTTIRYIIKGTLEEHVLKIQKHKRMLAEVLFSGEDRDETVQIEELRSFLK